MKDLDLLKEAQRKQRTSDILGLCSAVAPMADDSGNPELIAKARKMEELFHGGKQGKAYLIAQEIEQKLRGAN